VATAILAIPQYLNVVETAAPTNGGAAGRNGARAGQGDEGPHEGGVGAGAGERDEDSGSGDRGVGLEPGKAVVAGRRLETWQLLTAHQNGQCQLWHECSEGLRHHRRGMLAGQARPVAACAPPGACCVRIPRHVALPPPARALQLAALPSCKGVDW